ncbi:UNVERIFIED_CONTAM: hypothetical protein GTU68_011372 [Idotea baltica]|nr:hypothetical protein [Idotea baltica]
MVKGKSPLVTFEGCDKQLIGLVAAKLRGLRKIEPYKGKGVRFVGEQIRRKAVIDDVKGQTLASASAKSLGLSGLNLENAKKVGEGLAKLAVENGISACVFDRGGYLYHGNVKALAEGARAGGLNF